MGPAISIAKAAFIVPGKIARDCAPGIRPEVQLQKKASGLVGK